MGLSVAVLIAGLFVIYLALQKLGILGKPDESANAG